MDIAIWFLVLALFLPRITLLIAWFSGGIPLNDIPFIGDFLLAVFLPRVLILIYIASNLGVSSPWFWIHLVVMLIAWMFHCVRFIAKTSNAR